MIWLPPSPRSLARSRAFSETLAKVDRLILIRFPPLHVLPGALPDALLVALPDARLVVLLVALLVALPNALPKEGERLCKKTIRGGVLR